MLLVVLVAYLAYVGYAGSEQAVEPPSPSHDCRTPAIAFGWTYEAINYDAGSDLRLRELGGSDRLRSAARRGRR